MNRQNRKPVAGNDQNAPYPPANGFRFLIGENKMAKKRKLTDWEKYLERAAVEGALRSQAWARMEAFAKDPALKIDLAWKKGWTPWAVTEFVFPLWEKKLRTRRFDWLPTQADKKIDFEDMGIMFAKWKREWTEKENKGEKNNG